MILRRAAATRIGSVLLFGVISSGCGPSIIEDSLETAWMLGTWSSRAVLENGGPATTLSYWSVDDRTATLSTVECGSDGREFNGEYAWADVGADAIEIELAHQPIDGEPIIERLAYLVFRGACEQHDAREAMYLVDEIDGRELHENDGSWVRGEVCMNPIDGSDACYLVWCSGAPPEPLPCE